MRVAVAGGTGWIGRLVVEHLRDSGHDVGILARSTGVDLTTGAGLESGLSGASAVIDVSTMTTTSRRRSVAFFDAVSRHLTTRSGRTGVAHLVALAIAPAEPGTRSGRAPAGAGPRGPETFDEWLRRTQGSVDAPGSLRS